MNAALAVVSLSAIALFRWHSLLGHDYWCYLATGRYIMTQGCFPRFDVFSWTVYGHPWVAHEWLFQLLLYWAYQLGSWNAMTIFQILWIFAALLFVQQRLNDAKIPSVLQWGTVLTVFWGSRARWGLRADLPSIVFLSLLSYTFLRKNSGHRDGMLLWSWPFLFCLWANMHGGFILGLAVATLFALDQWQANRLEHKKLLTWLILCFIGTFVNPYGIGLYRSIIHSLPSLGSSVLLEWTPTPWVPYQYFWGALIFFWIVFGFSQKWRNIAWPQLFLHLLLSWIAIRHRRNVVFFLVVSFPQCLVWLWAWWEDRGIAQRLAKFNAVGVLVALAASSVAIGRMAPQVHWRLAPDFFAKESCDFIEKSNIQEPIFNDFSLGSYWLWRFGTTKPLFIDSRLHAVEGYLELFEKSYAARTGTAAEWNHFLDNFHIESAVIEYRPTEVGPASAFYFDRTFWALTYWDDQTMIFVRRDAKNKGLIQKTEFRWVIPDESLPDFLARLQRASPTDRALAHAELMRSQSLHPRSRRVHRFLTAFFSH